MAVSPAPFQSSGDVLTAANYNKLPRSVVGYASVTAAQASIGTTYTDLTSLTVTWTATAGRLYRIEGHGMIFSSSGSPTTANFAIRTGSTTTAFVQGPTSGGYYSQFHVFALVAPSAGSVTYKLSALCSGTSTPQITFQASTDAPGFILVEDLGTA